VFYNFYTNFTVTIGYDCPASEGYYVGLNWTLDVFFNFFFWWCGSSLHSHTLFLFILKFFDVLGLLAASAGHLIQPNALLSLPSVPAKARGAAAALCACGAAVTVLVR
jgi:hypothetical protein